MAAARVREHPDLQLCAEFCVSNCVRMKRLRFCKSPALGELRRDEERLHLGLQQRRRRRRRRRRLAWDAALAPVLVFGFHHLVAGEGRGRSNYLGKIQWKESS